MAEHNYVIDNQSAPSFRTDLNNALMAIVSQNSKATEPTTTYANMIWYDTTNNQIKKRNEVNSVWITLGTVDEGAGTFTPSGERALATQAQAEAGTDNATLMTPLRVSQAISALSAAANANLSAGAVGSYAFARATGTALWGQTYAGSGLIAAAGLAAEFSDADTAFNSDSTTLSGTWRCMGDQTSNNPGGDHPYSWTIFLRVL